MAARDVVTLNETLARLEVAQTGDTYNLPSDTNVAGNLTVAGNQTLGGVARNTWPAPGNATQALTGVLTNGEKGNIPAGGAFELRDNTGVTTHFAVDEATGRVSGAGVLPTRDNL
ncbi:MAG: hypothetical protein ACE5FI_19040, partial [Anaerolineales bacterium]